jgi:hypothetical protein
MPDMNYTTPLLGDRDYPWSVMNPHHSHDQDQNLMSGQPRQEKNSRQVVVTLRDDQLGQLVRHDLGLMADKVC